MVLMQRLWLLMAIFSLCWTSPQSTARGQTTCTPPINISGEILSGYGNPVIDGEYIAWIGSDGDLEVFLYDGSEVTQITHNDTDDFDVQISGNHLVWVNYDKTNYQ